MATRVLVVEDEETVALTLNAILTDDGYEVDEAPTAADALRLIESATYDVALLDLRLGADDGLAILRRLKEVAPNTVAVILTGYGSLDTAVQAMRIGASDYLLKPCDVVELKSAIARGLGRRSSDRGTDTAPEREEVERVTAAARQARDDFLELAGHHLKTPLTSVLGWTQYAQRELARGRTEAASEKLELAIQHSRRIARLVEVFSDMVRVQQGLGLTREQADLRAVLGLAARAAGATWPRHRFELSLPEEPVLAVIDVAAVSTIVSSLLDNAAKFSPVGAEVSVRLTVEHDEAVIAVSDQGLGIAADELEAVFERRLPSARSTPRGVVPGLGMGLYLSRALAEAHGGRIWVQSAGAGQGSAFFVTLPLQVRANDSPQKQAPA